MLSRPLSRGDENASRNGRESIAPGAPARKNKAALRTLITSSAVEGDRMGLLERRNPRATRRSVFLWTTGGGIVGGIVALVGWLRSDMPTWAVFFIVPWMTVFGAVGGEAMEWQIPPDADDDIEQGGAPDRGGH
jgi:hypothetical protein